MRLLTALILTFCVCAASAEDSPGPALKPGKWHVTVTTSLPIAEKPLNQTLDQCIKPGNTTPIEQMMKNNQCSVTKRTVEGNSLKWQMECTSKTGKATGDGVFTSDGETGSAQMQMTATFQGKPLTTVTTWTGKRIGSCD